MLVPPYLVRVSGLTQGGDEFNGTGFFVSREGHIATCLHVIRPGGENAKRVSVYMKGSSIPFVCELVDASEKDDLAVIKPLPFDQPVECAILNPNWENEAENWASMTFCGHSSHEHYSEGQRMSCPISGLGRKDYRVGVAGSINSGDSGGPVMDVNGKVVGIIAQKDTKRAGQGRFIPVLPLINLLRVRGVKYLITPGETAASAEMKQSLLERYRDHLKKRVSRVRLFNREYALEKVFVELTVIEEYKKPSQEAAEYSRDARWAGIADADSRRRREAYFQRTTGETKAETERTGRRTVKPTALLRPGERAFVVGAPGCGKTTLLRYLVWKDACDEQRLPVLLELKNVTEEALKDAGDNLAEVLLEKSVCDALHLNDAERRAFRELFYERLKDGRLAVYLDGLDEASGTPHIERLCRSIIAFDSSAHAGGIIVSSRPYAYRSLGGLRAMEISPLTLTQIRRFLNHYLDRDEGERERTGRVYATVQRRREMFELARVPFLLSVIAQVVESEQDAVGGRLSLYNQIVNRLAVEIDQSRGLERFEVKDPGGKRKRDFLKLLAFERLLTDGVEGATDRIVFDDEVLTEKARLFCREEGISEYRLFLTDLKNSPLLREVGQDTYAFSHLTIHEYLAADRMKSSPDCAQLFCRAYFDPTLVEMEVLPILLGLVRDPNEYYRMMERLPDSLNLVNLRLRARGLAYVRVLDARHHERLVSEVVALLFSRPKEAAPYADSVLRSLSAAGDEFLAPILVRVESLCERGHKDVRLRAIEAMGLIGHDNSVPVLIKCVRGDEETRTKAVEALKAIGGEAVVEELLRLLQDDDATIRETALFAIKDIGGDLAVERLLELACLPGQGEDSPLMKALNEGKQRLERSAIGGQLLSSLQNLIDQEDDGTLGMWLSAIFTVLHMEGQRGLAELLSLVRKDYEKGVNDLLPDVFMNLYGDGAAERLLGAMTGELWLAREQAGRTLAKMNDERIIPGLIEVLKHGENWSNDRAAAVLGKMGRAGDMRVAASLLPLLESEDAEVRSLSAKLLGAMRAQDEMPALIKMLRTDEDVSVRSMGAVGLEWAGHKEFTPELVNALRDTEVWVRRRTVAVLANVNDERAVSALRQTLLTDADEGVRESAAKSLGAMKASAAVPELLSALRAETDENAKQAIIEALGNIGDSRACEDLIAAMREDENDLFGSTRGKAAVALGKIGDRSVVPALLDALASGDSVMLSAASALGELKSEESVGALSQCLISYRPFTAETVAKALVKIGGAYAASELIAALTMIGDAEASRNVAEALGEVGDAVVAVGLTLNLSSPHEGVRRLAAERVGYYSRGREVVSLLSAVGVDGEAKGARAAACATLWKLSLLPKELLPEDAGLPEPCEPPEPEEDFLSRCRIARCVSQPSSPELVAEALAVISSAVSHDDAHSTFTIGLVENDLIEEAEAELQAWLVCSPSSAPAHHGVGWLRDFQGRRDEAKTEYLEAIRLDPKSSGSLNNLANIYVSEYEYSKAEDAFRESIRINPDYATSRRNLADLLVKRDRLDEAEAEFREAIRIAPDDANALHGLGMLLSNLGKLPEAEEVYLKKLQLDGADAAALNNLGLVYEQQGRAEEAEARYREAIRCRADFTHPYRNLKNLLIEAGRREEAEAALRGWIHEEKFLSELHVDLAQLLREQGRADEAVKVYQEWLECAPESKAAYEPLVNLLEEQGRMAEAEAASREWAAKDAGNWYPRRAMWLLMMKQRKGAEALSEYRRWLNENEVWAWTKSYFAETLAEQGFKEGAEELLLEDVRRDSATFDSSRDLARFYVGQKRFEDAERVLRAWLADHEDDGHAHLELGISYAENGRTTEAEAELVAALRCFVDSGEAVPYGFVSSIRSTYWKVEMYAQGAAVLTEALRMKPDLEEAHYTRGLLYWYGGSLREALSDYNRVLESKPEDIGALNARGQVMAELAEYGPAITDLEKAIELDKAAGGIYGVAAYARNGLAFALGGQGKLDEAMRVFDESINLSPENGWVYLNRGLIQARSGNLAAAESDILLSIEKADPPLPRRKREEALAHLERLRGRRDT